MARILALQQQSSQRSPVFYVFKVSIWETVAEYVEPDITILDLDASCDTTSNSEHEIKDVLSRNMIHSLNMVRKKTILILKN